MNERSGFLLECYPEACVCADLTEELDEGLVAHVEAATRFAVPHVVAVQVRQLAALAVRLRA